MWAYVAVEMHLFALERLEEILGLRVVIRVAFGRHANLDADRVQTFDIDRASVLDTAIRVVNEAGRELAQRNRVVEGRQRQLGIDIAAIGKTSACTISGLGSIYRSRLLSPCPGVSLSPLPQPSRIRLCRRHERDSHQAQCHNGEIQLRPCGSPVNERTRENAHQPKHNQPHDSTRVVLARPR